MTKKYAVYYDSDGPLKGFLRLQKSGFNSEEEALQYILTLSKKYIYIVLQYYQGV